MVLVKKFNQENINKASKSFTCSDHWIQYDAFEPQGFSMTKKLIQFKIQKHYFKKVKSKDVDSIIHNLLK